MCFLLFSLKIFILLMLYKIFLKLNTGICKSNVCLIGKTAIVTGGNTGIGYETTLSLASRGCRVIIASRTCDDKIRDDIIKKTNNFNIITKRLDLCSFDSIRKFATDITATEERLDILINNAGVGNGFRTTADELKTLMRINHYGPFLLTHLLTDLLIKSAPSRIIFVSSTASFFHKFKDMEVDLVQPAVNMKYRAYANSKLLNIITSQGFAEKLEEYGVKSNAVHPGVVATDIYEKSLKSYYLTRLFDLILGLISKNPYEGAQTTIHLAVSDEVKDITGKFFMDCCQLAKPGAAYNNDLCKKIWNLSERVVNLEEDKSNYNS